MKSEFIVTKKRWRHHFPHSKSMGTLKAYNSVVSGPIWQKFELVLDFMHVLVTCKYKKYQITINREKTLFSPLYVNGGFCCHGNQSFDPICPKTLCSLSPIPVMLHINLIKIGQLASEIHVFKFEGVDDD